MRIFHMKTRFFLCALLVTCLSGAIQAEAHRKGKNGYLEEALRAEKWIASTELKQKSGLAWPITAEKPGDILHTLYTGTPGVVLFYLELYHASGDKRFLGKACGGADHLLEYLSGDKKKYFGFYVGVGGIGFVLEHVYKASGIKKYRQGAIQCLRLLKDNAVKVGNGVEWQYKFPKKDGKGFDTYSVTDIIAGSAGTGLFLLYMGKELKDSQWTGLAVLAGKRLIEYGIKKEGGLCLPMGESAKRFMPNFSHGTAGNAYFLTILYRETGKKEFLNTAMECANYLVTIARQDKDTCLVHHHTPGGENLYYLGYCHGPVGTSRLFYSLYQITGDKKWMVLVEKGAQAILNSGIPGKQTPGFWNNVSRCCGTSGVAEFFLDLYLVTKKKKYLAFSKKMTADMLKKSTADGKGIKWIQAEHRAKPDFLQAQTGLMQGASGIGLWLLKLHAFEKGKKHKIKFPDTPF